MYYYSDSIDDVTYSIDMLRLKTFISYSTFSEIEFRFNTCWKDYIKKFYTTGRMKEFFYNYVVEDEKENSFYFGFLHNSEKRIDNENSKYNLTIEFNPNKLKDNKIIDYILSLSGEWYIKSYDIAMDVKVNILDLIVDKSGKRKIQMLSNGYDDITYRIGSGDCKVKLYNKKKESNLQICGDLTRIEVSRTLEDYPVQKIALFKYDGFFPKVFLNEYVMSLSDYNDKTLLALSYAVQHGFPLNDLTKTYRRKIKNMFKGGYEIKFHSNVVEDVFKQVVYSYFYKNLKVKWGR